MKIAVINGSPAGDNSITLQTVLYIAKKFPKAEFTYLNAGSRIRSYEKDFSEAAKTLEEAKVILFAYPVYTFLVPSQLHRFVELMKESEINLEGKFATQISTSKHFYDTTAHRFIQENCDDMKLKSIKGLSADMEDLLHEKGRKEAVMFWKHVEFCVKRDIYEPVIYPGCKNVEMSHISICIDKRKTEALEEQCAELSENTDTSIGAETRKPIGKASSSALRTHRANRIHRIVIVTDIAGHAGPHYERLQTMIDKFRNELSKHNNEKRQFISDVIDIGLFPFKGGCLGCFNCAGTGKCIYADHFDEYLRDNIQKSDAIVYAFTIKDHSMGYRFKVYDDRQFCNGHRTVTMGKPQGYLIEGAYSREENIRTLVTARAQVGGNYLAGVAANESGRAAFEAATEAVAEAAEAADTQIRQLAQNLSYAVMHQYQQPADFYGVGGMKIFRDLIWQMQGMMKEDHRFYKAHGFYDFPQKQRGKMLAMYLVGFMMTNKKVKKKLGSKMTEGMLLPYRHVMEKE